MEKLSVSQEEYLREIYQIYLEGKTVRVTDVALRLGTTKPSVNKAMNMLVQMGYLSHEHYGAIELTEEGIVLGQELLKTYEVSYQFLSRVLEVPPDLAQKEAHGMEHVICAQTRERLQAFLSDYEKTQGKESKEEDAPVEDDVSASLEERQIPGKNTMTDIAPQSDGNGLQTGSDSVPDLFTEQEESRPVEESIREKKKKKDEGKEKNTIKGTSSKKDKGKEKDNKDGKEKKEKKKKKKKLYM